MATIDDVKLSYRAIARTDLNDAAATATAAAIDGGQLSLQQYQTSLIQQFQTTTQAALALSTMITGLVPTSEKLDSLTAFAKIQNDYYTNVLKSANAQLGAYEALGKAYAADPTTSAAFAAKFGALSTAEFVTAAYATAFTSAPSAGAIANLTAQVTYFTNLYVAAGIPAAAASLQAKGAVFGQIIGYAATTPNAPAPAPQSGLDEQLFTTLDTIADQAVAKVDSTVYGKALPGVSGNAIVIAANGSVSLDIASNGAGTFKATTGNDTVSGTISDATLNQAVTVNTAAGDDSIGTAASKVIVTESIGTGISIDGSAGVDSLYATAGSVLGTTTKIANVEKIFLNGATFAADATNWTGVQELWAHNTTGATTVSAISAGVKIGIENSASGGSFTFKAGVADADLTLKNAAGAVVATGTAGDFKTLTVHAESTSTLASLTTAATTVTVNGAADLSVTAALAGTIKTFSAADATGKLTLGLTAGTDGSTFTLGKGADTVGLDLTAVAGSKFTLGDGKDVATVDIAKFSNVDIDAVTNKLSKLAEITDFKSGDDKIKVDVAANTDLIAFNNASLVGQSTIEQALAIVAANADAVATKAVVFEFLNNTYIYTDKGGNAFDIGDGLVKLAGVGYTIGNSADAVANATKDIYFI